MGKVYDGIERRIRGWMADQHMFFVATAPLSVDGSVNCSPKGHDTLRVLDDRTLIYLDYGGSGVETIAHIRENGRVTIMMCAFRGPPKIFRFHGHGEVIPANHPEFEALAGHFDHDLLGIRSIIKVHVTRVSDSCGYGVPTYAYEGERPQTRAYAEQVGAEKMRDYLFVNNETSLDGLPGLTKDEADASSPGH